MILTVPRGPDGNPDLPPGIRKWTTLADDHGDTVTIRVLDQKWIDRDAEREMQLAVEPALAAARVLVRQAVKLGGLYPHEVEAVEDLFDEWAPGMTIGAGKVLRHQGKLYETVIGHTTQADWEPQNEAALFNVLWEPTPDGEPHERWSLREGSHDAYPLGHRVIHPNAQDDGIDWVFESLLEANTTEPGTDGTFHRWWEPIEPA